ncbi:sodium/proline symporter PutP [Shewanella fidelis]|uniref:Sodium/proline symporter n=1 Tax=Shewanella fidelis TaxID=173509 RepID=A0AAW8NJ41_9GAMM|nr:sodium/proline symporter PutP [Shewanella fidelis]MDR8523337.1 sodium/proline symporter PutP [Shewanella fidelis]MDW4811337.1 sodium/proline symporter PutP [Shewanella fidelis]MDW4815458.1 sodium/proline symporter PutP [Shewanella fidelis]MDW4819548.1 sodium/proline symporter PutP [Shewanella fidelis]MDW4824478.1 sodium/proline symporter PutP [Shewanella fidelis]
MTIELPILITFIGYLSLMMGIGLWAYKATDSVDDYILGGRGMGPGVTALSVGASDMSGWLLLGLPGAVYLGGLGEAWIGFGLVFGAWLNWLFVAKRLRVYTQFTDNALTLPDFFEKRFEDNKGILKLVSAITILVFFTFYASSGMVGGAILFEKVFGLDYTLALVIGSTIIVAYTFVGGFFAVSWTDFFQGCLMLIALLIVPVAIMSQPETQAGLENIDPKMLAFISDDTTVVGIISLLAWGLGYFGQPHILSRFMAIASPKDIPVSRRIAMSWMLLALVGALATGIAGSLYFAAEPLANPETVFIHLAHAAFNPWIGGLLIAAILSAIMSTIDSQLLVCSSVITEDFYKKWLRPQAQSKELMLVGRIGVLAIAVIAGVVALNPESSVLGLVSYAWAGFGAAFGPVVLLALFWRDYSRNGAVATIVVGALTVVVWKQLEDGIFSIYEILPGFILATLSGVIVSMINRPSDTIKQQFDQFEAKL